MEGIDGKKVEFCAKRKVEVGMSLNVKPLSRPFGRQDKESEQLSVRLLLAVAAVNTTLW